MPHSTEVDRRRHKYLAAHERKLVEHVRSRAPNLPPTEAVRAVMDVIQRSDISEADLARGEPTAGVLRAVSIQAELAEFAIRAARGVSFLGPQDAPDVAQDATFEVLKWAKTRDPDGTIRPLLWRVARCRAIDLARHAATTGAMKRALAGRGLVADISSPDPVLSGLAESVCSTAVDRVAPDAGKRREAAWAILTIDATNAEISAKVELSQWEVSRIRAKLHREIEDLVLGAS